MNYNNYNQFWLERLSHDAIQNGKNHFTKEEIQWALKQADYKYFGDYEMDDNQRIAVSIMVCVFVRVILLCSVLLLSFCIFVLLLNTIIR